MVFWKHRNQAHESHDHPAHGVQPAHLTERDVRAAYDQGRREERKRHKSHPILGLLVAVVAVVGGLMLFLAAREGSFSQAGAVADRKIEQARAEGPDAIRDVALGARTQSGETAQTLAQNGDGSAR